MSLIEQHQHSNMSPILWVPPFKAKYMYGSMEWEEDGYWFKACLECDFIERWRTIQTWIKYQCTHKHEKWSREPVDRMACDVCREEMSQVGRYPGGIPPNRTKEQDILNKWRANGL